MAEEFGTSEETGKKDNTLLIIVIVALVVVCCCCLIVSGAIYLLWNYGDQWIEGLGQLLYLLA